MSKFRDWITRRDGGSVTVEHHTIYGTYRTTVQAVREFDPVEDEKRLELFAEALRKWWSFDDHQQHTHSWHTREDFIEKMLPKLLSR